VLGPYTFSGRSIYDISQGVLDPFPDSHYLEYLNSAAVQQAIGAPTNYTQDSQAVFPAFLATGDYARDGTLRELVDLLNSGIRIALIYGDRDYVCN
jgi:Serine carboxypeptidase